MLSKESAAQKAKYIGICVDILQKLAKDLKFTYELHTTSDNNYGVFDKETLEWDGLIKDILAQVFVFILIHYVKI